MAKHGGNKRMKSFVVSRKIIIPKKERVWVTKPSPGTHNRSKSVALSTFLVSIIKLASIASEANKVIRRGGVKVDGRVIKNYKFPVGFMDLIHIPSINMTFVVDLDSKGRLIARRDDNAVSKLVKVVGKSMIKDGKMQVHLDNGFVLILDTPCNIGDTLEISVPDYKVKRVFPLAPGARCVITEGKNAGERGVIQSIPEVGKGRAAIASIRSDNGTEFTTLKKYVFVLGG